MVTFTFILHIRAGEWPYTFVQMIAYTVLVEIIIYHYFETFNKVYVKHQKLSLAYKQVKLILDQLPTGVAILNLSTDGNFSSNSIMYYNAALSQIVSKWDASRQIIEGQRRIGSEDIQRLFQ